MAPHLSLTTRTGGPRPAPTAAWLLAACALFSPFAATAQNFTAPSDDTAAAATAAGSVRTGPAAPTGAPAAMPAQPLVTETTGPITPEADDPLGPTGAIEEDLGRLNLRQGTVDGLRTQLDRSRDDETPGIRIGTFTLKPTLGQTFNHERESDGSSRSYLETGLKGTLTSDWSRHQLTVVGEGFWQRNVSGTGETEPLADVEAELRLDIGTDTIGRLRAGYHFEREDSTDPNAISGASVQSGIDQYTLGAGIEHDFGLLRGSAKVDFDRYVYGSAKLSDGTTLSLKDRDRDVGIVTARIGYELSPALVPFLEASAGKSIYELRRDRAGFERSYDTYAGRAGVEVDLGEKLRGEIALGYETYRFDDGRLDDLDGLTIDGLINWSPRRGTDVTYGISTGIDPSTTPGENGALIYALSNTVTHELRSALVARLANTLTFRNYPSGSLSPDQTVWFAGAGLTWDLNRYLALTGDISYERTMQEIGPDTDVAKIGVGLTLRR